MNKSEKVDFADLPGDLEDDIWYFPEIITKNKNNAEMFWIIYAGLIYTDETNYDDPKFVPIKDSYMQCNEQIDFYGWYKVDSGHTEGKVKDSAPTIIKCGKNLGKKNATNVFQQTLRDCHSKYTKQLTKSGVNENIDGLKLIPPMLASVYNPTKGVEYPVFAQRKFDGVRAMFARGDTRIVGYSRSLKEYLLNHIKAELEPVLDIYPGLFIDGEVYSHGMPLQKINSIVRKADKNVDQTALEYRIYDAFINIEDTFSERLKILDEVEDYITKNKLQYIQVVETLEIDNEIDLMKEYHQFVNEKYEGLMIRLDQPYVPSFNSHHSKVLLKLKPKFDAEFKLIDYAISDCGKLSGGIVLVCETSDGVEFNLNPAMTIDERIRYAKRFQVVEKNKKTIFENRFQNKMIVVVFDDYSTDKVPLRARTSMLFRDENMDFYEISVD